MKHARFRLPSVSVDEHDWWHGSDDIYSWVTGEPNSINVCCNLPV